jgi:hypothetical protein
MGGNRGHGQRVAADLGEPGASPFPPLPPERSGRHDVGNGLDLPPGWKVVVPVAPASKMPGPNAELEPSGSPESPSPLPAEVASVGTPDELSSPRRFRHLHRGGRRDDPGQSPAPAGLTEGSRTLAVGRQYVFGTRSPPATLSLANNQALGTGALTPPGGSEGHPWSSWATRILARHHNQRRSTGPRQRKHQRVHGG